MSKVFFCEDVLICGCPVELRAATEEEIVSRAAAHARTAHGIQHLDVQVARKVRTSILTR